jgi:hypothetical protein
MGASARCPYCGAVRGDDASGPAGETRQAIDALYREVARIRELAEHPRTDSEPARAACNGHAQPATEAAAGAAAEAAGTAAGSREAALLREIALLRETVARLRGTSHAAGS